MKQFFALWVVWLVFAAIAGLICGVVDYFFAEIPPSVFDNPSLSPNRCWNSIYWNSMNSIFNKYYIDACDRIEFIGIATRISFLNMLWIYPVIQTIRSSFKFVFTKDK